MSGEQTAKSLLRTIIKNFLKVMECCGHKADDKVQQAGDTDYCRECQIKMRVCYSCAKRLPQHVQMLEPYQEQITWVQFGAIYGEKPGLLIKFGLEEKHGPEAESIQFVVLEEHYGSYLAE